MAGYHLKPIKKGILGEASKIREELEELEDALAQDCLIMATLELSDIYGALEEVAFSFGITMDDVKKMSDITKRAFINGER